MGLSLNILVFVHRFSGPQKNSHACTSAKRIAERRVKSAEFADLLLTSCPFCVNNLLIGKESIGSEIEIKDIVEFVDELLEGNNS